MGSKLINIIVGIIVFFLLVIAAIFSGGSSNSNMNFGTSNVPEHITKWRPVLTEYCQKYGCTEYVEFLLALMYQESGYSGTLDVMQSSESLGLKPNELQDPIKSIDAGVKHFKYVLDYGNSHGVDFNTIVQSYNFGQGYIDFISVNGKVHTIELATKFSNDQARINGWDSYGDINYVEHVMRYVTSFTTEGDLLEGVTSVQYSTIMNFVTKYEGHAYVYGGDNPLTGFDCSGIVQYSYRLAGINLGRTAQLQYNGCVPVSNPSPGDLVFFTNTYNCADYISHVGIYVGNNKMFHSGSSGIGYVDLSTNTFFQNHFVGYGRVK